jgi:dihydrofolate reductase
MPKLVVMTGVSIDGYMAARDGSHPFARGPEDPEMTRWKVERLNRVGAHLMGRITYGHMSQAWPSSTGPIADAMNARPKLVFSKTLEETPWGEARVARGELVDEIERAKGEYDGDLVAYGGASFVQSLSRERLVDEYWLSIHPAALGDGMPLFAGLPEPLQLDLVEANRYETGTVVHVYRRR